MSTTRQYHYKIDLEGRLWIEGTELKDPQVLKFFMKKMEKRGPGQYEVLCMGEHNKIEAEDVPYVVQSIRVKEDGVELIFPGNFRQTLDPATLFVGQDNVLYCKIRKGEFVARFQRKPYLELSKMMEGGPGQGYFLNWQGDKYPISGVKEENA